MNSSPVTPEWPEYVIMFILLLCLIIGQLR